MTTAEDTDVREMNWDPITRIVGSLGIYTKIDFKQKKVIECYSTSSIFRGYSIFMKGKDPRDAHLITSRICAYRTLMLAGMHFMDSYNYDVERVKRCVIHYAAPNGKIYPFCAYNSGPVYRERIEREFSIPFEQQPAMKALQLQGKKGAGITEPELVG